MTCSYLLMKLRGELTVYVLANAEDWDLYQHDDEECYRVTYGNAIGTIEGGDPIVTALRQQLTWPCHPNGYYICVHGGMSDAHMRYPC